MSDSESRVRIYVCPEPSLEEMAAISASVLAIIPQLSDGDDAKPAGGSRERWARAGRREVLRGTDWAVERTW